MAGEREREERGDRGEMTKIERRERDGGREDGSPRERGIRGKRTHDFQENAIQIKFFTFSRHYRSLVH